MKLGFSSGQQNNLDPALLTLKQHWPFHLGLPPVAPRVLHLERPAAAHLDAIVVLLARRHAVDPKAGARIFDLQQSNRSSRMILDSSFNVIGVAPCQSHQRRYRNYCRNTGTNLHSLLPSPSVGVWAASFFSTRSSRFSSSCSRWKMVTARSHTRLSKPGEPEMTLPAGISCEMPLCAVRITPSPTTQWPATAACPARMTLLPTSDDPASPTCPHSSVFSPTCEPCPTWTKLSTLVPSPMRVSPTVARSIQALACTSRSEERRVGKEC